jgi:hypothetical protein
MLDNLEEMLRERAAPSPEAGPGSQDGGRGDGGNGTRDGGRTAPARREGKLDLRNSWQVLAGSILIPLGVVLIMIGWYGAAHARVVQQQIPYMVSGSFVGLGCMVVGGFLFWGHWLYRMYDQAELHHEEQQRLLELIAAGLRLPAGVGAGVGPGAEDRGDATAGFYATTSGSVYHRPDCAVIAHHPDDLRTVGPGGLAGLRPCQICLPV